MNCVIENITNVKYFISYKPTSRENVLDVINEKETPVGYCKPSKIEEFSKLDNYTT